MANNDDNLTAAFCTFKHWLNFKLRVCEPPSALYNDIQRVSPMANLFRQSHTVAVLLRLLVNMVNVNIQAHSYITVMVSTCAECFKRKAMHVHILT